MPESQRPILRKHVAVIHSSNPHGSLVERKAVNVLLLNARQKTLEECGGIDFIAEHFRKLKGQEVTFEIPLDIFKQNINYNSHDHVFIREALKSIASTALEYSIISSNGDKEWEIMPILSYAKLTSNRVIYRLPSEIREQLVYPEVYANIDLAIQNEFVSSHALTLYENIYRFINMGKTPVFRVTDIKRLLGIGKNAYPEFKIFNREVIKRSIREIGQVSNIKVTDVTPEREGRYIVGLQFHLSRKSEVLGSKSNNDDIEISHFESALYGFGLSKLQIGKLFNIHNTTELWTRIMNVQSQIAKRKDIKNTAAYAWSALSANDNAKQSSAKNHQNKSPTNETKLTIHGKKSFSEIMSQASPELVKKLKTLFIKEKGSNKNSLRDMDIAALAKKDLWEDKSVATAFKFFVEATMYVRKDLEKEMIG